MIAPTESNLALRGGPKTVNDPDHSAWRWPVFDAEEKAAVARLLDDYSHIHYTEMSAFEEELRHYFGCCHALTCNNGTAAIHSAMHAIGLRPGDEVISPSYTYWATSLTTRLVGAVPVFADVCPDSANIDPEAIERKITSRTRAIIVTHLWGMPCEMDAILDVARRHGLRVIEDASHAHGAEYRGRKIGTWGDIGCFSMQGSKLLPAIEGGFLLTNDFDLFAKACVLGHYGRVPADHEWRGLNSTGLGYKYRIHPVATTLARHRLRKLDEQNRHIAARVARVTARIAKLPGIEPFRVPPHMKRVHYQFEVRYHDGQTGVPKTRIIEALLAEGARVTDERYPLQHRQEVYQRADFWPALPATSISLPVSESLHDSILQLPTFATCDEAIVDQYIAAFEKVWANLDLLR